ncbi:MAG: EF-hand domain-containing protein [Burkholderiales bacterium]
MRRVWLPAAAVLAVAPLCAQPLTPPAGDPAGQRLDRQFRQADRDGDGALSKQEARLHAPDVLRKFDRMDTDRDGKVSREEFERAYQTRARRELDRFRMLDTDHDGFLSRQEFAKEAPQGQSAFSALDRNKDGRISQEEYQRMIQRHYWSDLDKSPIPGLIYQKAF